MRNMWRLEASVLPSVQVEREWKDVRLWLSSTSPAPTTDASSLQVQALMKKRRRQGTVLTDSRRQIVVCWSLGTAARTIKTAVPSRHASLPKGCHGATLWGTAAGLLCSAWLAASQTPHTRAHIYASNKARLLLCSALLCSSHPQDASEDIVAHALAIRELGALAMCFWVGGGQNAQQTWTKEDIEAQLGLCSDLLHQRHRLHLLCGHRRCSHVLCNFLQGTCRIADHSLTGKTNVHRAHADGREAHLEHITALPALQKFHLLPRAAKMEF